MFALRKNEITSKDFPRKSFSVSVIQITKLRATTPLPSSCAYVIGFDLWRDIVHGPGSRLILGKPFESCCATGKEDILHY